MTPEMERIGKILVEAEGGCWHEWPKWWGNTPMKCLVCNTDINDVYGTGLPDFSQWQHFGRLLKIAEKQDILKVEDADRTIDQIPALVATELARVIEEGK